MKKTNLNKFYTKCACYAFAGVLSLMVLAGSSEEVKAASLRVSPDTAVYTAGGTFTTRVLINTAGKPVNAAEGRLSFNPLELSVIGVSRGSSIFNLWTQEPIFSNAAGTVSFGGGSPSGYTGSGGTVMTITFKALAAGTPKVTFTGGSVLAADGRGTNVLTNMSGATYTVSSPTTNPEPEYIAPENTPDRPVVTSTSHPDPEGWYEDATAVLSWDVPSDVTSVRTLLDESPGTIPSIVYDEPITERTIEDLDQGVSYFHIQFRNADGWGKVAHYRIGVDSHAPTSFEIVESEEVDEENPKKTLAFIVEDLSPVTRYLIQIDGGETVEFLDEDETGVYALPVLDPGRHTIIVEAFDSAGHSLSASHTFEVASFEKPTFTEYPSRINTEVIPVFRGSTIPNATVHIEVNRVNGEKSIYQVTADDTGVFTFIPDGTFELGLYDLVAIATDKFGIKSDPSDTVRVIVEDPGYIKIGSLAISVLSIIIPFVALVIILIFGSWYLWNRLRRWRRRVHKETIEAEERLKIEFDAIVANLSANVAKLKKARKGKLTKAESALIEELSSDISDARARIKKEMSDIEDIVK